MTQQKVARGRKAPIPEAYSQRPAHHRCASTRYQTSPFLKAFAYQSFTKSRNCVAKYRLTACAPSNPTLLCRALLTRAWLRTPCTNLGTALTSASKASGMPRLSNYAIYYYYQPERPTSWPRIQC